MRSLTIGFNVLMLAASVAVSAPAHAVRLFDSTKMTRPYGPALNFYAEVVTEDHPEVVGGDLFMVPVAGTPHTSATIPCDVAIRIHLERNGASGELAKHEDQQPLKIRFYRPDEDYRIPNVAAEENPRDERRRDNRDERFSGMLVKEYQPDQLPFGLLKFKADTPYYQSPPMIYLYRSHLTLRQMMEIQRSMAAGTVPNITPNDPPKVHSMSDSGGDGDVSTSSSKSECLTNTNSGGGGTAPQSDPPANNSSKSSKPRSRFEPIPVGGGSSFEQSTQTGGSSPTSGTEVGGENIGAYQVAGVKVTKPNRPPVQRISILLDGSESNTLVHPVHLAWLIKPGNGGKEYRVRIDDKSIHAGEVLVQEFGDHDQVFLLMCPEHTSKYWGLSPNVKTKGFYLLQPEF